MPRRVLFCAFLVGIAMWSPIFCVPPMEPLLKGQLLLTYTQTGLLLSAPVLMLVAVAIPAGLASDRIGVKKATGIGLIIMAIGAVLRGTAVDFTSLLAFTFVFGVGFGWTLPNLPKLVSVYVPKEKANVAMGVVNAGFPVGTALGMAVTVPVTFSETIILAPAIWAMVRMTFLMGSSFLRVMVTSFGRLMSTMLPSTL